MSETIASQAAEENNAGNVKEPRLAWMIGFLFLVSFVGLFALVPLRKVSLPLNHIAPGSSFASQTEKSEKSETDKKALGFAFQVMIIDYRLTYPSGTATAHLINGFHTPDGSERAK